MPKRVVDKISTALEQEIRTRFRVGQRFHSVREVARKHRVSPPSASAALAHLVQWGLLAVKPRSGMTVTALRRDQHRQRRRILVLSRTFDTEFNNAILRGVRNRCGEHFAVSFLIDPVSDVASLPHGEYLLDLGYPAIIAVGMRKAVLPLYYLQSCGVDVVSSVAVPELPDFPASVVDVARHSGICIRALHRGRKRLLHLVSSRSNPDGSEIIQQLRSDFLAAVPDGSVRTISLRQPEGSLALQAVLNGWRGEHALVAVDGSSNHAAAQAFQQAGIPTQGNLCLFEGPEDVCVFAGLMPIPVVAPSFYARGWQLADKLVTKLETGTWRQPMMEVV